MNKATSRIPVLVYHEIVTNGGIEELSNVLQKKYIVERTILDKQLQYLFERNYDCFTISEILMHKETLKQNIACITFDDGYVGNFTFALPLLKKYGFKATFFVVSNWVRREYMMTWEQIKALINEGMEIGSHTNNHRLLETCDRVTIQKELEESRKSIKKYSGYDTEVLSYPNGSYSRLVNEIARNTGYKAVLTSDFGYENRRNPSFAIKRIFITNDVESLAKTIKANPFFLFISCFEECLKKALRFIIGRATYDHIYNNFFNINIRT